MTSLDGEYLLLGRKVDDTANIFIQYGQGATRTFNTTQGYRVQGEWIDGFRMSVQTQEDALINADVKQPFTPVDGMIDTVAALAQAFDQQARGLAVVLDEQYVHGATE